MTPRSPLALLTLALWLFGMLLLFNAGNDDDQKIWIQSGPDDNEGILISLPAEPDQFSGRLS